MSPLHFPNPKTTPGAAFPIGVNVSINVKTPGTNLTAAIMGPKITILGITIGFTQPIVPAALNGTTVLKVNYPKGFQVNFTYTASAGGTATKGFCNATSNLKDSSIAAPFDPSSGTIPSKRNRTYTEPAQGTLVEFDPNVVIANGSASIDLSLMINWIKDANGKQVAQ